MIESAGSPCFLWFVIAQTKLSYAVAIAVYLLITDLAENLSMI